MNIEQIKKFTTVLADKQVLDRYSTDASIFSIRPKAVVVPKQISELKELINWAHQNSSPSQLISLTPRNAGSCMTGGSLTEDLVVDMNEGFSWIDDINHTERTVWVGSGYLYRDLDAVLKPQKLLFAPMTGSRDYCGIGGMIGNNASGEKSLRYGSTIDNIKSIRAVLQDGKEYEFGPLTSAELQEKLQDQGDEGNIYRSVVKLLEDNWEHIWQARPNVRKNTAGYQLWRVWDRDKIEFNLAKLFVGSQGTLGFVTGAELLLVPRPTHARMMVVPIDNLSELAKVVKCMSGYRPESIEAFDNYTYELAKIHMPEQALLAHSVAGHKMVLFAQFSEKTKDETDHAENICQTALRKLGFDSRTVRNESESDAIWAIRRASYKLLKNYAKLRAVPFIEDTVVPVEHYSEFLASLEAVLTDYDMEYTFAGHVGDGSIRLIPLVNMEDRSAPDKIFNLARRVFDLVFAFGGSMSADHGDGLIRSPFLKRMYDPEMFALFKTVKRIFDSKNIFNPHKKIDGTEDYAKEHMVKTNNIES